MGGFWKIDGRELTGTNITVHATAGSTGYPINVSSVDVRDAGESHETVSKKSPRRSLRFAVLGTGAIHAEAEWIATRLHENDTVTIEAPDTLRAFALGAANRAVFKPTGEPEVSEVSPNRVDVTVDAIALGVPIADGGGFEETINGTVTFLTNEYFATPSAAGSATGDALPLLWVPEQTSGYARADKNASPENDPLTLESTDTLLCSDGVTVGTVEAYDLTDHLFPVIAADGDSAVFRAKSSPTSAALDCG